MTAADGIENTTEVVDDEVVEDEVTVVDGADPDAAEEVEVEVVWAGYE